MFWSILHKVTCRRNKQKTEPFNNVGQAKHVNNYIKWGVHLAECDKQRQCSDFLQLWRQDLEYADRISGWGSVKHYSKKECPWYDTTLHLVVRLGNLENSFIAITLRSSLIGSGDTCQCPIYGSNRFESFSYWIRIHKTVRKF